MENSTRATSHEQDCGYAEHVQLCFGHYTELLIQYNGVWSFFKQKN